MSCQSCSGCFTGSDCSTTSKISKKDVMNGTVRFQSLLELAALQAGNLKSSKEHDHVIPTIMAELSKNVYSSQTALFQAYDSLPHQQFLSLAAYLYQFNIVGPLIAWAFEFCKNNPHQLLGILKTKDTETEKLAQHCNDQAEIHEMFGQLASGSVGRVAL